MIVVMMDCLSRLDCRDRFRHDHFHQGSLPPWFAATMVVIASVAAAVAATVVIPTMVVGSRNGGLALPVEIVAGIRAREMPHCRRTARRGSESHWAFHLGLLSGSISIRREAQYRFAPEQTLNTFVQFRFRLFSFFPAGFPVQRRARNDDVVGNFGVELLPIDAADAIGPERIAVVSRGRARCRSRQKPLARVSSSTAAT